MKINIGGNAMIHRNNVVAVIAIVLFGLAGAAQILAIGKKEPESVIAYQAPPREQSQASYASSPSDLSALEALQNQFRVVAEQVLPVVVEVNVVDVVRAGADSRSPFNFFGQRNDGTPREFRQPGLGSGVIVGRSSDIVYVLTNNHVVESADEIALTLFDGRQFNAELIGADARKDLALVRFETTEEVPIAVLGDSSSLMVGDIVFAVGNPLGFESTVTSGIVSALGRRAENQTNYTAYIQTDAAVNQGNSGGALVNLYGEVIGINTWIASNSGGSIGLGFAIPINAAKDAIDDFIESGAVEYGWLGITVGTLNEEMKRELGYEGLEGGFVYNVVNGSPAEDACILPGDLISRIGDVVVENHDELTMTVGNLSAGESRVFEVHRLGETFAIDVTIGRRDEAKIVSGDFQSWPGFSVATLTEAMRAQANIPEEAGSVIVGSVSPDSAAGVAGLRGGDIISAIDSENLEGLRDFFSVLNSGSDGRIEFTIFRRGAEISIGLPRR